jgi:hypothetical protein
VTTFNMKTGDLEPPLVIDISGSSGDLNDVMSWRVIGRRRATAELLFEDPDPGHEVDGEDPSKAVVTHHWVAGETDTPGVVHVEVEALWPRPPDSGYRWGPCWKESCDEYSGAGEPGADRPRPAR